MHDAHARARHAVSKLMCCKFQGVFILENICTLIQTHSHSDLGCLYKAGGLSQFHKSIS